MIKYELINYCEFDKYAAKAYSLIHSEPESKNLGDIALVNEKEIADFNIMVGGSPCQDFSVAGKQEGAVWTCKDCKDENGDDYQYNPLEVHYTKRDKCPKCESANIDKTRSSLVVEWLRILLEKKPNLAIYENVKNLVGKKHKYFYDLFINELHEYGYNTHWKVLNAKDYGVPQNRERVYLIIIKKELDNGKFQFPEGFDNGIRLKDLLEDVVDEKYYISQEKTNNLIEKLKDKEISNTIRSGGRGSLDRHSWDMVYVNNKEFQYVIKVGNTNPSGNGMNGCVYSEEGLAPTITTNKGEGKNFNQNKVVYDIEGLSPTINGQGHCGNEPKILEKNELIQIGKLDIKGMDCIKRVYSTDGICPTLTDMQGGNRQPKILEKETNKPIRKYNINKGGQGERVYDEEGISVALSSNHNGRDVLIESPSPELVGGIGEINFGKQYRQGNRVYSADKTAMCLLSQPVGNTGGNSYLYLVKDGEEIKDSFIEKKYKEFINKYGYIPEMFNPYNCSEVTDISPTTTAQCGSTTSSATVLVKDVHYRIRKLTPLECIRLMGFEDGVYYILKKNKISDTQIYKMAGNSIVVDVLYYILLEIYKVMPYLLEDIKLSSFFSGIGAFEKAIERLKTDILHTTSSV